MKGRTKEKKGLAFILLHKSQGNHLPFMIDIPYAYRVFVLGLTSVFSCLLFGIVGIICAITTLWFYRISIRIYEEDPHAYRPLSYNNLQIGKSAAILGLVLSTLYTLFLVSYYYFIILPGSGVEDIVGG